MSKEGSNEAGPQEGGAAGGDASKKDADIYETQGTKRIVRLITVMAYMFSVSFVAIVLSAYYLFLWEPPNPRLLRRPVHLTSEPEVQFLLSDQPIAADELKHFQDGPNVSRQSFTGRIADIRDVNNYNRAMDHREKVDESLYLLKNSLVEVLQNRLNSTKPSNRNISRGNWDISKTLNYTLLEKEKMSSSTERSNEKHSKHSAKIMKRMFNSNGISSTLDSSTISGDEANKDRFTSNRNNSVPDLTQTDFPLIYNLTGKKVVRREKYKKSAQANLNAKTITVNKESVKAEKSLGMHLSEEGHLNATRPAMNDESRFDIKNEATMEFSQNLKIENGFIHPQPSYQSPIRFTNVALMFKEMQTEKVTTDSVTEVNDQSLLPETITTERQKDLLTILTKITNSSTSASPLIESKGLKIDVTKETTGTDV